MNFLKNLSQKEIAGKTCLLRVDLNINNTDLYGLEHRFTQIIPLRLKGILPTIKFLTDNGAKVVILSHRGRPQKNSKFNPPTGGQILKFSLRPFAKILSKLLNKRVNFINFNTGTFDVPKLRTSDVLNIKKSSFISIFLLENLRFLIGEEKNDVKLAKQLASLGDFYVNDAFAVSHRNVASVAAITKFLPSYAGLLLEKEINSLDKARGITQKKNKKNGLVVILGGAKISDKIGLIENFKNKADYFLIGGGIANNFLLAQGLPIGDSIYDADSLRFILRFTRKKESLKKVILPVDYAIKNRKILDIGQNTVKMYSDIIKKARMIIWNGPMGYFENPKFAKGSEGIARAIVGNKKSFSVIGGGETTALLQSTNYNLQTNIFVSTGGGAMLEYLAGKKLPGIKALK